MSRSSALRSTKRREKQEAKRQGRVPAHQHRVSNGERRGDAPLRPVTWAASPSRQVWPPSPCAARSRTRLTSKLLVEILGGENDGHEEEKPEQAEEEGRRCHD